MSCDSPDTPSFDLTDLDLLAEAAECLKLLAHPVRLRIVEILAQGEVPVGEVARLCGTRSHQASGHLRAMESRGMVHGERRGRQVFYSISDPRVTTILDCIRSRCAAAVGPEATSG